MEIHTKKDSMMDFMCVECEDTEASIKCENCDDIYCTLCYQAQHHSGTRLQHKQIPLGDDVPLPPPPSSSSSSTATATAVTVIGTTPISNERNSPPSKTQKTSFDSSPTRFEIDPNTTTTSNTSTTTKEQVLIHPDEKDQDDNREELEEYLSGNDTNGTTHTNNQANAFMLQEAVFIPLRLNEEERHLFTLLDASLNVSEYTDKVDVFSYRSTANRIVKELIEIFSILSGMVVASDFRQGKKLVQNKKFEENQEFFQQIFEIGRRYKIMNPGMNDSLSKFYFIHHLTYCNNFFFFFF
jgi:hypothetical protein